MLLQAALAGGAAVFAAAAASAALLSRALARGRRGAAPWSWPSGCGSRLPASPSWRTRRPRWMS